MGLHSGLLCLNQCFARQAEAGQMVVGMFYMQLMQRCQLKLQHEHTCLVSDSC